MATPPPRPRPPPPRRPPPPPSPPLELNGNGILDLNGNGILDLNGTSAWLTSVVMTKSMLCGFMKWSNEAHSKVNVIWTVKMIDRWHGVTVQKMENHFLHNRGFWRQLPRWAKEIFRNRDELTRINNLENHNKATELHTVLLATASQLLLNISGSGAGQHNTSQIKLWFDSLKLAKSLSLFNQATRVTTSRLDAIMTTYNNRDSSRAQENGANKLHHDMLLIHIAHMVNFACAPTHPTHEQDQRQINCSHEEHRKWSVAAGGWHATHLNLGAPGSCIGDVNNHVTKNLFAMIEVPTDQLFSNLAKSECPNVIAYHQEILDRMAAAIEQSKHENPTDNGVGSFQFAELQQKAVHFLKDTSRVLCASKKEWINRLTHRNNKTRYQPRPPKQLMNDAFVMGVESYYFMFKNVGSPTKRKHDNSPDRADGSSICDSPFAKLARLPDFPRLRL